MTAEVIKSYNGNKALRFVVLTVQILVGAAFTAIGLMKLLTPISELAQTVIWAGEYPVWFVRGIGLIDLAGGLGMILPSLTRIKPQVANIAACCSAALMLIAAAFHISRGETDVIGMNLFLFVLIAFVFWGRTQKVPILPR